MDVESFNALLVNKPEFYKNIFEGIIKSNTNFYIVSYGTGPHFRQILKRLVDSKIVTDEYLDKHVITPDKYLGGWKLFYQYRRIEYQKKYIVMLFKNSYFFKAFL